MLQQLPLKTSRASCRVFAAVGSSAAAPNRVRRTRVQREAPPSVSGTDAKETRKDSSADLSTTASSSSTDGRQRVRRMQSAKPAGPSTTSSSSPSSSTSTDPSTRARKNPDLYSLVAEGFQAATQAHQQHHQQQQPQQSQEPADHAAAAPAAAETPWPLPSLQGVVGSTGAYSGTPQQQSQQQQQWQQLPGPSSSSSSSSSSSVGPPLLRHKPEVLSPAGGWPQLRAAVENGADAVYFGVTGFNARARAANFSIEELPEVMSYLRARGVKGYVALNILVFDQELPELEGVIRHLATAGVDALIVQDIGAVALARRVAPNLPIHGSTQMSITSAEGAEFAASLGVSRVVVGRELSVLEIAKVAAHTRSEVEAFCHGALCVSYSGQCFSSEAWGGRSANRGQCAQACRMPYALIVDGEFKSLDDMSYLLSPQDLMALEQLPQMVAAGVSCFKIEGRLKGPEYVAATTAAYRAGVDAAWEQYLQQQQGNEASSSQRHSNANSGSSSSSSSSLVAPEVLSAMAQVFSRAQDEAYGGLTPGFLEGSRHQRLVRGRAPRHRGLCLGRIAGFTNKGGVLIRGLLNPVKRGDGVVFDQGTPEKDEQGGSVWEVMRAPYPSDQNNTSSRNNNSRNGSSRGSSSSSRNGRSSSSSSGPGKYSASSGVQCRDGRAAAGDSVELLFAPDQLDVSALSVGDLVWKNRDPAVEAQLRASYEGKSSSEMRKTLVQVHVSGSLGSPLRLQLTDGDGHTAVADTGDVLLSPAVKRALTPDDVVAAIGQLGDNTLAPADIDMQELDLDQGIFLPASAWKAVRRAAADQLLDLQQHHGYAEGLAEQPVLPQLLQAATEHTHNSSRPSSSSSEQGQHGAAAAAARQQAQVPSIRVLCRTPDQVSAALAVPWLEEVIVDFLEVHGLKEAVAAVKGAGKQVVVALPRILKPDESRLLWFYLKLGADALLLRGAGPLQQLLELGGPGAVVHSLEGLSSSSKTSSSHSTSNGSAAADQVQEPAAAAAAPAASKGVTIPRLEGDFSLNAANVLSTDLLLRSGLSRLCPTHDLNAGQLVALAEGLTPLGSSRNGTNSSSSSSNNNSSSSSSSQPAGSASHQLEAVVHQHLPIFHTEHCVFCRFLSDGNDYRDCGHPCESHTVQLRDSAGAEHLVLADMGCRNTVFNASAQSGLHYLPRIAAAGYGMLRVELVNETADFVKPLLETYWRVLQGRQKPREAWRWLQESCAGGVAAGSLEVKGERAVSSLRPSARRT